MSITFDGERSKQRFGMAKRWLGNLKTMGMPSKMLTHEGFTYRLANIADGLQKGRITAPDGLVVACTQKDGVSIMWADYWHGGFGGAQDLHVINDAYVGSGQLVIAYLSEIANAKFDPRQTRTFIVSDGFIDSVPTPSILTSIGERGWLCVSGVVEGVASWQVAESFLLAYQQSGKSEKRFCVAHQIANNTAGWELGKRVSQCVWSRYMLVVSHSIGAYLLDVDQSNAPSCAVIMTGGRSAGPVVGYAHFYLGLMSLGAPAGLQSAMLSVSPPLAGAMGSYAFTKNASEEPTLLHCVDATGASAYFIANPSDAPWKLFFTFYTFGAGVLHSFPVNTTVLAALVPSVIVSGEVDWVKATEVMRQLFPWPNNNHNCPVDSMMFHTLAGEVYSWSRKYGAVRFSIAGMSQATINIPAAASTPGTRPEIYNAGNDVYLCICTAPADKYEVDPADPTPYAPPSDGAWNGVKGVYVGSPFGSWVELPYPAGARILHIKPLRASLTDVQLLGIVLNLSTGAINAASLTWNDVAGGAWKILAPVPVTIADVDVAQWSISPYGEGELTSFAMGFPHPAPALPQMPKTPYNAVIGHTP